MITNREIARKIKVISLGILGIVSSLLVFYFFNQLLIELTLISVFLVIIFAWLFLVIISLQVFFLSEFKDIVILSIIEGIMPFLIFSSYVYPETNYLVVGGILVFVFLLILGLKHGFGLLKNSLKIPIISVAHRIIPKVVMGFLIFSSVISYSYFFQQGHLSSGSAQKIFDRSLNSALPLLQIWFPEVTFDTEVDKAILKITESQIQQSRLELLREGIKLDDLNLTAKEDLAIQTSSRVKEVAEKIFGEIIPGQTLREALYNTLSEKLLSLPGSARTILEVGTIVIFFFAFKAMAFILYIPAEITVLLIFKLLLLLRFGSIKLEDKSKEIIAL